MAYMPIVTKSGSVFKTYTNIVYHKFVIICEQGDIDNDKCVDHTLKHVLNGRFYQHPLSNN